MNLPLEVINVSNSEKLLRLLKMISLIERSSGALLKNLVEECDVCERTIYRDLEALSQVVFRFTLMKRQRYHLWKKYSCGLAFTVDEANAVLACLQDFSKQ